MAQHARKGTNLPDYRWANYDDDALLKLRFSSLHLRLKSSRVWADVERLWSELERRGIRFRPHVWLSTEWFCPDGIPGFAIPFYLAHPRLTRLERKIMGKGEDSGHKWRMRILRHETGHAIDNAYALRRRADWRKVFGRGGAPYPDIYSPRPNSDRYVLHLGHWYAQSHPTEDFAETFAVWMQPKARWRRDYAEWPAIRKLEFVDGIMEEISARAPKHRSRSVVDPLASVNQTLGEYYQMKTDCYGAVDDRYDRWIKRIFTTRARRPRAHAASRFLREIEPQLRRLLERRARLHPYDIDHAIETVILRSRQLDLVLRGPRREAKRPVVRLHERIVADVLRRNRELYAL